MIWYYIIVAVIIGIIAGFGYYFNNKSYLKNMGYEKQELALMLRKSKRNAIIIGVIVGVVWPLILIVLAACLIFVSLVLTIYLVSYLLPHTAKETKKVENVENVDLTNHNIVLDEHKDVNVVNDDTAKWTDLNKADKAESDNIETTNSNTKE